MRTGWSAVVFGWTAFVVPVLFVLSPQLLLIGGFWAVSLAVVTAVAGVWLIAIAITGYFARALPLVMRLGFALAGVLALIPAGAFPGALTTDIVGVLAGLGLIVRETLRARRTP